MLVLSRKLGQSLVIGDDVYVTVVDIRSDGSVRLGFTAPREVEIDRSEIRAKKIREGRKPRP